jgi:type IV secretory pathway VirB10-like protein
LLRIWLLAVAVAVSAAGCHHAAAKSVKDLPPLNMPLPPPRVVETVEATAPPPVTLVEEPERQPVRSPNRPVPPREAARPEPPKAEPKAESPPEIPRIIEEPAKPPPTNLQTTPPSTDGEVERTIRNVITRAEADLGHIDYRVLSKDGRNQYDTAKRFIQQAKEALDPRTRNLLFARNLADKALALAGQLGKR